MDFQKSFDGSLRGLLWADSFLVTSLSLTSVSFVWSLGKVVLRLVLLHEILLWSLFGRSLPSPLFLVAVSAAVKKLDRKSVRPWHANDSAFCLAIVSLQLVSTNLHAGHVGRKQLTRFIYFFTPIHLQSAFFLFYFAAELGMKIVLFETACLCPRLVFSQPQTEVVIVTKVTACWPHKHACGWWVLGFSDVHSR